MPERWRASTSSDLLLCFSCGWSNWWLEILIRFVKYDDILSTLLLQVHKNSSFSIILCFTLAQFVTTISLIRSDYLFPFHFISRKTWNQSSSFSSSSRDDHNKTKSNLKRSVLISNDEDKNKYAYLIVCEIVFSTPQIGRNWNFLSLSPHLSKPDLVGVIYVQMRVIAVLILRTW